MIGWIMNFSRSGRINKKAMIKASRARINEILNKTDRTPEESAADFVEIEVEEEMIEHLKSLIFLEANEHLPVATPNRDEDSGYWKKGHYTGRWYLSEEGYEFLSERYDNAGQRRFEKRTRLIGPITALFGVLTGLGGVAIGVISILGE